LPAGEAARRIAGGEPSALRLDMAKALKGSGAAGLSWREGPPGAPPAEIGANSAAWGDAVLRRKEFTASYHLAVVIDDAFQGVTHVVRGRDLYHATALHRLLQALLGLPEPRYHHHGLIVGEDGGKLAKSKGSPALADLRARGLTPAEVRAMAVI
jgi:glutamyl-Q tRNA(Asp) synthetase